MVVEELFEAFLLKHFVFSLNVVAEGSRPYSAPCFYVYKPEQKTIVFVSDRQTQHLTSALVNPRVSGSVYEETESISEIAGVQFTGRFFEPESDEKKRWAKRQFCHRFPYARLKKTPAWLIQLEWVKFTDNSRHFGFKEVWELK